MTEPVHPPDSLSLSSPTSLPSLPSPTSLPSLPFGSAAELLARITTQLGTQLSGLRPPRTRPSETSHAAAHPRRRGPRQP
ncbi:hypothetical protein [Streptomyces yangpuensis]|uniref:hypothetical protein n=1 Tax=Streptomyces yangpuensis TaxID=1648182 RepID=UPI0036699B46